MRGRIEALSTTGQRDRDREICRDRERDRDRERERDIRSDMI